MRLRKQYEKYIFVFYTENSCFNAQRLWCVFNNFRVYARMLTFEYKHKRAHI